MSNRIWLGMKDSSLRFNFQRVLCYHYINPQKIGPPERRPVLTITRCGIYSYLRVSFYNFSLLGEF